ncbi:hypothetical protein [Granulicella sp. L46]|jgi:hypothetical protein|uniref:hypothetical protein n=1 Tax=Granulicella sp. L46 TaxID=1641865 RepID=UPI00131C7D43|nr:hypothetical protein [Granulicella sp. L46]
MDYVQHLYAAMNSFEDGSVGLTISSLVGAKATGGNAMVVSNFTRRQTQNSEEGSGVGAGGKQRDRSGPPRYLFYFRGKRHPLQTAGSRSKNDGVLEFWFGAGIVLALVAIVVLVCLHSLAVVL